MKKTNDTLFICAMLALCFPAGVFLLWRAERTLKFKLICCGAGLLAALLLLSAALLFREKTVAPPDLHACATRTELYTGQSGGLCVTDGQRYCTSFTAMASNDVLTVRGGVYTAAKPGVCTLTVTAEGRTEQLTVTVKPADGDPSDTLVYITASGSRYHSRIEHAGKNAVEVPEEDALLSAKTPCKICYKNNAP